VKSILFELIDKIPKTFLKIALQLMQGILSEPGIAGYE